MSTEPELDDYAQDDSVAVIEAAVTDAVIKLASLYRVRGLPALPIVDAIVSTGLALSIASRGVAPTVAEIRRAADDLEKRQDELADPRVETAH